MAEKPVSTTSKEAVEAREREWLERVYRGGTAPEFTLRAVLSGMVLGVLMSFSNLYVGFKTGWTLGVSITASILGFALFRSLEKALPFLRRRPFGDLENNISQSVASAAGYIASAGLVSAVPALMMVTGKTLPGWKISLWVATLTLLGLTMAIPMKRQMINVENLKFPTGFATGELLKTMYAEGGEALRKARLLLSALGAGLVVAWSRDGVLGYPLFRGFRAVTEAGVVQWKRLLPAIPATFVPSSWKAFGLPFSRLTLSFEGSLIMVGAGALMGIRVGASLLLAAVLNYGFLAPLFIRRGDIVHTPPRVVAPWAFGEAPSVAGVRDLAFPLRVKAGETLAFSLEEEGQAPRLLALSWTREKRYRNAGELLAALSAPEVEPGTPNPFSGVLVFRYDRGLRRLTAEAASVPARPASLAVLGSGEAPPALGFAAGTTGRSLAFPLSVPAATRLLVRTGTMTGPQTAYAVEDLAFTWNGPARYQSAEELLLALNGKELPGGGPNPLAGKVAFSMERHRLAASAVALTQWDAFVEVPPSGGAALLGFAGGEKRTVPCGGFRSIVQWSMWPGVAMMVTAGLLSFFMQWRTVLRAFSGLRAMFGKRGTAGEEDPLSAVEVPGSWFAAGFVLSGGAAVLLQMAFFGISPWMAVLAVLMTFFLAIVACRATGETDITPVGAMGKITQLLYGALAPGNMTANLMTANVTGGAATSSADLLQGLKCGYLLGASPRKQFFAQMLGIVTGAALCVPVYQVLVPSAEVLGTDRLPAPAAQVWAGVALLLSNGLKALPVSARWSLLVGGLLGIAITLCEKSFPKSRRFLPSPTGMGIALVIPAFNSVSMFLGALAAWMVEKRREAWNEAYTVPIASGLIAGESLMGITVALLANVLKWVP
ncbi:MAG: OPT/YSL family transporter [Acidobacteriota bacterium]